MRLLKKTLLLIISFLTILLFQNCSSKNYSLSSFDSIFKISNSDNNTNSLDQSGGGGAGGNGQGYEGKPLGEWVRIVPDLKCKQNQFLSRLIITDTEIKQINTDPVTCQETIKTLNANEIQASNQQRHVIGFRDGIYINQPIYEKNLQNSSIIWCTATDNSEILVFNENSLNWQDPKSLNNLKAYLWINPNINSQSSKTNNFEKIIFSEIRSNLTVNKQKLTLTSDPSMVSTSQFTLTVDASVPIKSQPNNTIQPNDPANQDSFYLGSLNTQETKKLSCRLGHQFDGYRWPSQIAKNLKIKMASYNSLNDQLWILGSGSDLLTNIFNFNLKTESLKPISYHPSTNSNIFHFIDLNDRLLISENRNGFNLLQYKYSLDSVDKGQLSVLGQRVLFDPITFINHVDFTTTNSDWYLKQSFGMNPRKQNNNFMFFSSTEGQTNQKWNLLNSFKQYHFSTNTLLPLSKLIPNSESNFISNLNNNIVSNSLNSNSFLHSITAMNLTDSLIIQASANCPQEYSFCQLIEYYIYHPKLNIPIDNNTESDFKSLQLNAILKNQFNQNFQLVSIKPLLSPNDQWLLFLAISPENKTQWFKYDLINNILSKMDFSFQPDITVPSLHENPDNLTTYEWLDNEHIFHNHSIYDLKSDSKLEFQKVLNYQKWSQSVTNSIPNEMQNLILVSSIQNNQPELVLYNLTTRQIIKNINLAPNHLMNPLVDLLDQPLTQDPNWINDLSNIEIYLAPKKSDGIQFPLLRHFKSNDLLQLCVLEFKNNFDHQFKCQDRFILSSLKVKNLKTESDQIFFMSDNIFGKTCLYVTSLQDGYTMMINDRSDLFGSVTKYIIRDSKSIYFQSYIYSKNESLGYTYLFQWKSE